MTSAGFLIVAQSVFLSNLGFMELLLSTVSVSDVASQFKQLVPERYEGDLSQQLERVLDPCLPASASLPWIFSVAAFLGSNKYFSASQMDAFLAWIVDQGHTESLAVFMKIQTRTIHTFANVLLSSAIRIKSVQILDTLLKGGVELDSKLYAIAYIGDIDLTRRVLLNADSASFEGGNGESVFQLFVQKHHFDLAQFLLDRGVSPDAL
jgi:hypothetical protein